MIQKLGSMVNNLTGKFDPSVKNSHLNSPDYAYFLFINKTSGGNRAGIFLQLKAEVITFQIKVVDTTLICNLYFVDLFDELQILRATELIKRDQLIGVKTRAIVCGGDGTVMWVVDKLMENNVDTCECPIGIVPYGTGNDFSRVLGWGGDTPDDIMGPQLNTLRCLIAKWVNAAIEDFDIWDIKVVCQANGQIRAIKKDGSNFMKQTISSQKTYYKKMSNYFSVGVCARIGFGFDKNRSQSPFWNKCIYCCEGFKKMFLKNPAINDTLKSLDIYKQNIDQENEVVNLDSKMLEGDVIFTTEVSKNEGIQNPLLQGNPVSLLWLNIPSFSGGVSNVWQACQGKIGIVNQNEPKSISDSFGLQQFGDGNIELVTFETIIGMGNERFISGQAKRIAQGKGPFILKFKDADPQNQNFRQYIQIDGEYLEVSHPKQITIQLNDRLPNGKIKVLVDKQYRENNIT